MSDTTPRHPNGMPVYSELLETFVDRQWGDSPDLVRVPREEYDLLMSDRGFRLGNRFGPVRAMPEDRVL